MKLSKEQDAAFMQRTLELAERYRGRTSPNPVVGCVIVDARGEVIAEGVHKGPGTKHAEADALAKLGGQVPAGSTMYVNLEPCTHQGRTPPCAPAVKASGVARVVVGTVDPVPGHGGGVELLRRAGISVTRALVAECDDANRPFLTWAMSDRPAFTLKAAITLDGKIATVSGQSKWITGDAARADVHWQRDLHDAVIVGIGTVLADDPWLNIRLTKPPPHRPPFRYPIRIVLDGQLRTPPDAHLLPRKKGPRTIIATTTKASEAKEKALVKQGAEVWRFPARANGHIPLDLLAHRLGKEGITSVLVEGGGEVHASFLKYQMGDEVLLYIAPKVVGGPAPSWVGGKGLASLASAHKFELIETIELGGDIRLRLVRVERPASNVSIEDIDDD